ncbi:MAG TPA: GNAT family N-acetyltransferase [Balneolaceae bacterium]
MSIEEHQIKKTELIDLKENGGSENSSDGTLNVLVISGTEMFDGISEEWRNVAEISSTYIFQTYEWNRIWWKHFGDGQQLNILLFYQDDLLLGIAPLFLDKVTFMGLKMYSCLRFIGSTVSQPEGEDLKGLLPYSDYLDLIIRPGYERQVNRKFMEYLANNELDFNEVVLDEIPENSSLRNYLMPDLEEQDKDYLVQQSSACPVIELGRSWDEHLADMSKSSRYKTRRFIKQAEKPGYKIFEIKEAPDKAGIEKAYEKLVKLHQKRWKDLGYPGIFDEKRMYNFLKEITLEFFDHGWAQCKLAHSIEENGKCIAVDLLFKYKRREYLVQRALDSDSPSAEHGPGNVLLYVMLRDAAEKGIEEFDLLRGTESYKFRSANSLLKNDTVTFKNPGKKLALNFGFTKKFIKSRRRFRIEHEQFKIFLNGEKNLFNNIHDYGNFLYNRLSLKFNSKG